MALAGLGELPVGPADGGAVALTAEMVAEAVGEALERCERVEIMFTAFTHAPTHALEPLKMLRELSLIHNGLRVVPTLASSAAQTLTRLSPWRTRP